MIYIVDDFYPNPDAIREKALELDFIDGVDEKGIRHHTGIRCNNPSWLNMIYLRNRFKSILGRKIVAFKNNTSIIIKRIRKS